MGRGWWCGKCVCVCVWRGDADSRTTSSYQHSKLALKALSQELPRKSAWGPNSESPVSVLGESFLASNDLAFL